MSTYRKIHGRSIQWVRITLFLIRENAQKMVRLCLNLWQINFLQYAVISYHIEKLIKFSGIRFAFIVSSRLIIPVKNAKHWLRKKRNRRRCDDGKHFWKGKHRTNWRDETFWREYCGRPCVIESAARFLLLSACAVGVRKNHHFAFDRRPRNCKRRWYINK